MKNYNWATLGCGVIANQLAAAMQKEGRNRILFRKSGTINDCISLLLSIFLCSRYLSGIKHRI